MLFACKSESDRRTPLRSLRGAAAAFLLGAAFIMPGIAPGSAPLAHAQQAGPASVADLAENLLGAVVNISTSQRVRERRPSAPIPQLPDGSPFQEFFDDLFPRGGDDDDGPSRNRQSLGSGFVISADGLIVTNNHVISDADEIVANFADGTKLVAEVIGTDPKTDIAVLKVENGGDLPFVPLGDSESARIGDWVLAIGNPFGLGGSVSIGIVSAIGRDINSGPYDNFIQTDAAINRGNSGGPLFNMNGEVIGINTAIISPSGGSIGIGFAVPTALAMPVIDQLVEFGETRRGWLGVQIQNVSEEIAESLGLDSARGALVGDVFSGGPADEAGIESGDVILTFDGREVETMRELPRIVADTAIGKEVDVVVFRRGEEVTLKAMVGRLEDSEPTAVSAEGDKGKDEEAKPDANEPVLGMLLAEITDELRAEKELPEDLSGVYVDKVEEGSDAADKGFQSGMVILEVNQEEVATPQDVRDRVAALRDQGRENAVMMVANSDGDIRFIVVRIAG